MRGVLTIIHPDRPIELRFLSAPLGPDELSHIVHGLVEIIPHWDQFVDYGGQISRAVAVANEEGHMMKLPFNFWATAAWHYILASKGIKGFNVRTLTGPVVVITGDEDFMENAL